MEVRCTLQFKWTYVTKTGILCYSIDINYFFEYGNFFIDMQSSFVYGSLPNRMVQRSLYGVHARFRLSISKRLQLRGLFISSPGKVDGNCSSTTKW